MLFFKIWKISCTNPPLCKKNFFDMPFLISHGGVFHKGSKLANLKKVYHKVCVLQRLCLLSIPYTKMCLKGPKVGPFRSLFAPILVTKVSQIDYKATKLVENESLGSPTTVSIKTIILIE